MRGPANLDEILAGVLREAKTASAREPEVAPVRTGSALSKLASALRAAPELGVSGPTYADLYTVKEALYGR